MMSHDPKKLFVVEVSSEWASSKSSAVNLDSAAEKLSSSQLVHLNTPQPISSSAVKLTWVVRRHGRYIQGFVVKCRPLLGNDDHAPAAGSQVTEVRVAGSDVTSYQLEGLAKYTWYEVSVQPYYQSVLGRQSTAQVRTLDDGIYYNLVANTNGDARCKNFYRVTNFAVLYLAYFNVVYCTNVFYVSRSVGRSLINV